MKIGLTSPIVTAVPGQASEWERTAGPRDLALVAQEADRLGMHHLTCSEHSAVPVSVAQTRGGTYWDPLSTLAFLAAMTSHIRLATHVLVLGYHHPLALAKSYGTLDLLSGGRLILGVGVGSLEEEFVALGRRFDGRGQKADDDLCTLRAIMSQERPQHPAYRDFVISPHAVQEHVPFWVGGRTQRSLRRALELGDGWAPFGLPLGSVKEMLTEVELPQGFEIVLGTSRPVDPGGDGDGFQRTLKSFTRAGATTATLTVAARSLSHYLEQLAVIAELAPLSVVSETDIRGASVLGETT